MNTNTTSLTTLSVDQKITSLLSQPKITQQDIDVLTAAERKQFEATATKTLAKLKDAGRDSFLDKIDAILPVTTKNNFWEHNHQRIGDAVSAYMQRYGTMPTKNAIAEQTGLSRQTVAKHFKEYNAHPEFAAQTEQFKFMSHTVLANVFKYATNGDIGAARLFLQMVNPQSKQPTGTVVNKQNNYIQINNTILSQETLKQLSVEQLNQIENIVKNEQCKLMAV
jgi:hypothetical protein